MAKQIKLTIKLPAILAGKTVETVDVSSMLLMSMMMTTLYSSAATSMHEKDSIGSVVNFDAP